MAPPHLVSVVTTLRGWSKVMGFNLGQPCDRARQDSSSYGLDDIHSRVNAEGVIMWLKLVGEAQVDAF